ncbi:adaptin N terminal region-domain-containing protein [Phakopsora pachyrhizi]|uniref:AP-2 complex subunit alpha n=1 Tax=Phakopsora pachyrhizi TaxID=170000 RepID=A0AAV0BTH6_PHAPC|nr:adaptin N terminal region-domain-containing protein [Phakopsora pachyrhizi]CAH7690085.1 adaptin N terminal region-domain-containing protein [Phakopsora pachyrhizi]
MPTEMKGLNQYIADLRACRVRELEEKRINKEMANIRQKFKDGNLDGYSKKKYLAKIVFTYILGYQVDIGHMEAVNLISSTKYSEKQIGYLALTLLLHENSDLIRLVINSIRKDLDENNETNNCLALHAIANIGGREMSESLLSDVYSLLISPISKSFVRKKAALTLLRLYRKNPDVFPIADWALRIVSLMDDSDLGVCLAVTSLVMTLAQDNLDDFSVCYQKAVDRLHKIIVEQDTPSGYMYYKVPIPWLQCKLFRLLQYYQPTNDEAVSSTLNKVLRTTLDISHDTPKNIQHNNAQNAVLFEAINLAIHLDPNSDLVKRSFALLAKFILSKETNVRYLGLDTMSHLAARSENLDALKMHQDTIILSLRDKDISVRRRGLDLLYSMCDTTNSKAIVGELLRYLSVSDYTLREELVLKIAILTEKFATEYEWYLNTMLRLMSIAGDQIGDEVWYRVIQIVTNTLELQEYATKKVFEYIHMPVCHEQMIKVAAYIMGEFGHLVANEEGLSPIEQFQVLHSKANLCSASTRAMLLTTYLKWLNLFPEIKPQLMDVFERYTRVLDAELQQRACEYLAIAKYTDEELLQTICDEMPPFPERESALLSRLTKAQGETGDKRTWVIGGKEANRDKQETRLNGLRANKSLAASALNNSQASKPEQPSSDALEPGMISSELSSSLNGLEITSTPSLIPISAPSNLIYTHGTEKQLIKLSYSPEGMLYEDAQLQVALKSEYQGDRARMWLYFSNKISAPFESFTILVESSDSDALTINLPKIPTNVIEAMSQIEQIVHIECKSPFKSLPILKVSYLAGSLQTFMIKLPVYLTKFMLPIELNSQLFFERWKQIGGPPREAQEIFKIQVDSENGGKVYSTDRMSQLLSGFQFKLLSNVDPNPKNLVGSGVLNMSAGGKVGCLFRLEPNEQAKMARITVRTTNDLVSQELIKILTAPIKLSN